MLKHEIKDDNLYCQFLTESLESNIDLIKQQLFLLLHNDQKMRGVKLFKIDFKNVSNLGPESIGLLIALYNALNKQGVQLNLTNINYENYELLAIMQLEKHIKIQKTF